MKAHTPARTRLSRAQSRVVEEFVEEKMDQQRAVLMRRFFKLMAMALRDPLSGKGHGMGAGQIAKIIRRVGDYAAEHEWNREFWDEVDHVVIDRMGLPLEREELA